MCAPDPPAFDEGNHMMRYVRALPVLGCLLAAALTACSSEHKAKEPAPAAAAAPKTPAAAPQEPLTVRDSIDATVTAKVKAVDHATRVVTLRDDAGHEETFVVDKAVRRLDEVSVGDSVKASYKASLLAELRPPTAEEAAHPLAAVEAGGRSPQGAAPAAGAAQAFRVVTTVEAVDVPNMRVTLRGPMGDLAVVKGRNPENVKRLKVGDTIVITYTEAMVLSLEKTGK
jgi:hypothetical protein